MDFNILKKFRSSTVSGSSTETLTTGPATANPKAETKSSTTDSESQVGESSVLPVARVLRPDPPYIQKFEEALRKPIPIALLGSNRKADAGGLASKMARDSLNGWIENVARLFAEFTPKERHCILKLKMFSGGGRISQYWIEKLEGEGKVLQKRNRKVALRRTQETLENDLGEDKQAGSGPGTHKIVGEGHFRVLALHTALLNLAERAHKERGSGKEWPVIRKVIEKILDKLVCFAVLRSSDWVSSFPFDRYAEVLEMSEPLEQAGFGWRG
ncbi:hypothetical protein BJ508DRAFT_364842 [Ascobolus immersus RN42]|uniref:Uncharacterized protein n=1 Tax=Ascobolus immersus RN42 TaxID=1160509 RepID=A0A3N4HSR9_ASCIM|nr:hypothetical protein BJ508DRAFT_364842 [Ascobolus immersus RN42]